MVRFKSRYILLYIVFEDQRVDTRVTAGRMLAAIRERIQILFGDYGTGCTQGALQVKYLSVQTGLAVIRCGRDYGDMVKQAALFVTKVDARAVALHCIHYGGTIRCCYKSAIRFNKQKLRDMMVNSACPDELEGMKKHMMSSERAIYAALCNASLPAGKVV